MADSPIAHLDPGRILDSLPEGLYTVDESRRVNFWNAAAERITGYLSQEVIGRPCQQTLLAHCRENGCALCGTDCPIDRCFGTGRPVRMKAYLMHKEGHRIAVELRCTPVRSDAGTIVGVVQAFETVNLPGVPAFSSGGLNDVETMGQPGVGSEQFVEHYLTDRLKQPSHLSPGLGVILLALDQLHQIQRNGGAEASNRAVQMTTQTLLSCLRPQDLVGRHPGSRLVAVIEAAKPPYLLQIGERLRSMIHASGLPWWGERMKLTASVAYTTIGGEDDVPGVFERLGLAVEEAQQCGGDVVVEARS